MNFHLGLLDRYGFLDQNHYWQLILKKKNRIYNHIYMSWLQMSDHAELRHAINVFCKILKYSLAIPELWCILALAGDVKTLIMLHRADPLLFISWTAGALDVHSSSKPCRNSHLKMFKIYVELGDILTFSLFSIDLLEHDTHILECWAMLDVTTVTLLNHWHKHFKTQKHDPLFILLIWVICFSSEKRVSPLRRF